MWWPSHVDAQSSLCQNKYHSWNLKKSDIWLNNSIETERVRVFVICRNQITSRKYPIHCRQVHKRQEERLKCVSVWAMQDGSTQTGCLSSWSHFLSDGLLSVYWTPRAEDPHVASCLLSWLYYNQFACQTFTLTLTFANWKKHPVVSIILWVHLDLCPRLPLSVLCFSSPHPLLPHFLFAPLSRLLLNAAALFTWKWRRAESLSLDWRPPFTVITLFCSSVLWKEAHSCPAES